jgi:cytochrome c biogenesis protein CcdA
MGHALTLFAFGLPIVLFAAFLPHPVQQGVETLVGLMIAALAVWLLMRWRRGLFHAHAPGPRAPSRSPLQAFAIGLIHGIGGSAGVCVLLLATVDDRRRAVAALAVLAVATAASMTIVTGGLGFLLDRGALRRSINRLAPALGLASLLFGCWYALGALDVVPYYA